MNEQLVVKNFGPIKEAKVDFKRVTVFIGPTGGGKSTLAKLAAVFRQDYWQQEELKNDKKSLFDEMLVSFQISEYIKQNGRVQWWSSDTDASYTKGELLHDTTRSKRQKRHQNGWEILQQIAQRLGKSDSEELLREATPQELKVLEGMHIPDAVVHYIPADRAFSAALASALAGLTLNNIALPETLLVFVNEFNRAQKNLQHHPLEVRFLQVSYKLINNQPRVYFGTDEAIELGMSASGIQAVLPMMLVIDNTMRRGFTVPSYPYSFIIEEPELNLYPTAQQGLLNWLVEKCTKGENDLTITTHSPYILSSCNLLLEAYKVAQQRPELADEIDKIVPRACWLNPDEFAAYYVADGTVKPITDERTHLIGSNELDSVSGEISDSFRRLLQLKKQVA